MEITLQHKMVSVRGSTNLCKAGFPIIGVLHDPAFGVKIVQQVQLTITGNSYSDCAVYLNSHVPAAKLIWWGRDFDRVHLKPCRQAGFFKWTGLWKLVGTNYLWK